MRRGEIPILLCLKFCHLKITLYSRIYLIRTTIYMCVFNIIILYNNGNKKKFYYFHSSYPLDDHEGTYRSIRLYIYYINTTIFVLYNCCHPLNRVHIIFSIRVYIVFSFIIFFFFLYTLLLYYIVVSQPYTFGFIFTVDTFVQSVLLPNQTLFGCSSIRSGKCARRS